MRRIGVYVDASNVSMTGGHGMRYEILRTLACRADSEPQRLNVYLAFDELRAQREPEYGTKARNFHAILRDQGFRVTVKPVKRYVDEEGAERLKSNADLDLAVDVLMEAERLDSVMLVTGDGDFVQVAKSLQSRGCRVEVLAFDNVSSELRQTADQFINGFLIPNLLPIRQNPNAPAWGEVGSRVRGVCNKFLAEDGYGFLSYLCRVPEHRVIAEDETAPAYFRAADLVNSSIASKLPSRGIVLEFDLTPSNRPDGSMVARRIEVVSGA